ncbi:MAG: ATP-dependent zinc metalloprotease FtsH [Litorilinea sp.]|nr:MAG: ATP-dependent zinc metalloprotease FtsH [Litorilinea sp.]GIV80413.1 MAG: ATP-dependent zinc metalloprotease FtsH [Litorilinea sp.]
MQYGQDDPNERPPQGARFSRWFWLILTLIALLLNFWLFIPHEALRAELPYTAFLEQVKAGNVAQVEIKDQQVQGTFKEPILWAPDEQIEPVEHMTFATTLPPVEDARLLPLLEAKGVAVTARAAGTPWPAMLLVNGLPLLLLVGLFYTSARQMRQAQGSIFDFAHSKARQYDPARPRISFADVAGVEQAKLELAEVVDFLKSPAKYRRLGARIPRGVLLVGPPGTGKTLLARAVAGEAQVPFYAISASEFVEVFVGVGASRVRDLFKKAKETPASIVFVDELDAVGRQRGAGFGGGNDEREQTLNQLLVEMDGFDHGDNVIVIAATNRPDVLDPALLRPGRFDRQVVVGLPDRLGREGILRIHSRGMPLADDVDLAMLSRATPGFAGADLANLCNEAALIAARRNKIQVEMVDFQDALDKIVLGVEGSPLLDERERRTVAYHEAGHALIASLLPGADPVHRVTIIPHGRALGLTAQLPQEERYNHSRDDLLTRLTVLMGGRAAEEVALQQMTSGAENDFLQATWLAQGMVARWGMSEAVGPVGYRTGETHPFLGRDLALEREYSETTASLIDQEVKRLLEDAHQQAVDLLTTYRAQLDQLATALLHEETLDAARIQEILGLIPAALAGRRPVGRRVVTAVVRADPEPVDRP